MGTGTVKSRGAEQAKEKGPNSGEIRRMHTSGAKAQALFCGIYGTTEVVQFHDILYKLSPHILYSF
jgi:hypothetical protein